MLVNEHHKHKLAVHILNFGNIIFCSGDYPGILVVVFWQGKQLFQPVLLSRMKDWFAKTNSDKKYLLFWASGGFLYKLY